MNGSAANGSGSSGASCDHAWLLTAPWYRWPSQGVPVGGTGRGTRPELQKYAGADFVPRLLEEPQRSLRFDAVDDRYSYVPRHYARNVVRTSLRKVYLPSHDRFYAVTCELHCDVPGLPSPPFDDACEAGFVVRRIRAELPPGPFDTRAAVRHLRTVSRLDARHRGHLDNLDREAIKALERGDPPASLPGLQRVEAPERDEDVGSVLVESLRDALTPAARSREELDGARVLLRSWAEDEGVTLHVERWVVPRPPVGPGPAPSLPTTPPATPAAGWRPVDADTETPLDLDGEAWFPLYPLVPDPARPDHDAARRGLYFGVLPLSSADHDGAGQPRFDDRHVYEVRCFVRRHNPHCPRTGPGDCHGPLVWSLPTERYRIAAPFDGVGTGFRPTTIRAPDLPALRAQVQTGRLRGGVTFSTPADSNATGKFSGGDFARSGDGSGAPSNPEKQCFWAIPLIMLVALFLLAIFLPILLFIFRLWWMLALQFCLLTGRLDVTADLAAELSIPSRFLPRIEAGLAFDLETPERRQLVAALAPQALGGPGDPPLTDLQVEELLAELKQTMVGRADARDSALFYRHRDDLETLTTRSSVLVEETRVERALVLGP